MNYECRGNRCTFPIAELVVPFRQIATVKVIRARCIKGVVPFSRWGRHHRWLFRNAQSELAQCKIKKHRDAVEPCAGWVLVPLGQVEMF